MSALYFHIPFCKCICAYCDFHRFADLRALGRHTDAMHAELTESAGFLNDRDIRTIYFGGGTPSLLHPEELQRLADRADSVYGLGRVEEATVEVNPDDISREYVAALRRTCIDRVSIGVQSFDERVLKAMNRRHTPAQAEDAVKRLQDAGFENITADIIFGLDGFGDEVTAADLQKLVTLDVAHVSAYHLTIEPATRFGRMAERGELSPIPEERSERLFAMIHRTLTDAGFEHYEISNYARSGRRSRHNSSYWDGTEYLGIGAGAHSFNGTERRWSQQTPADYAAARRYESETLSDRDRFNETVMTSLRRKEGLDVEAIERRFGSGYASHLRSLIAEAGQYGAKFDGRTLTVPPEKMLVSDAVAALLFDA